MRETATSRWRLYIVKGGEACDELEIFSVHF
jgi:hypothetical protein